MSDTSIRSTIEIIGIIAVILSLILVAYELRQTRQAILGDTYLQMATHMSSQYFLLANNEPILESILKSEKDGFEALSPVQQLQLYTTSAAKRFELDAYYYQYELGLLDEDFYNHMLIPEFKSWYPRFTMMGTWDPSRLRPEFRKAVEAVQVSANPGKKASH